MASVATVARAMSILLVAVLLVACSDEAAAPPPPAPIPTPRVEPTRLVVGVGELPPGFNPHLLAHRSPVSTALATLVLPSVFRYDPAGVPVLDTTIATSAEVVSVEPFTVSYELNLEAAWSTNTPVAAEDFVYLWERMRGEPGTADAAGYRQITEVRSRAGGKAVDVVFAQAYPAWQRLFSNLLPAHLLKDAPGSWTGTTIGGLPASGGPFKVLTLDRARGEVVLARNDLYWDTPAVLDMLVLRSLDDAATAAALASGEVDVALPRADQGVRTALGSADPAVRLQAAPEPTVTQLGMRGDTGPMADARVRQAIGSLIDREALRAAVAPDALPADAFGVPPSGPGYAATAPPRLDAAAAAQLLAAAGWNRDLTTGRWARDGTPVRLVLAAAAERPDDQRVAEVVADQLDRAGIDVTVVAPPGVDLFGLPTVPATPPRTPLPGATTPSTPSPSSTLTPTTRSGSPSSTPRTAPTSAPPPPAGTVRVDLMVLPRAVGGDPGTELSSAYGCPPATALIPNPPDSPTAFCFPALQPLFDELMSATPRPDTAAVVERLLWQQLPALPLFQPVTLVASTPASDAVTGIGPGPLGTGPVTGAERWRAPAG